MAKKLVSSAKRKAGEKLHAKQMTKARKLYNASKSKFDKMAIAWCKKKHSNKKKKSKNTGKMYNYNVYMQFVAAVIKAGGSQHVAQILWAKHCKKYHADKTKKTTSSRKKTTSSRKKTTSSRKKTSSSKKTTSSSKKTISSGKAFTNAGKRLKKLRPKVKVTGPRYDTLAKRKAAIAKAK